MTARGAALALVRAAALTALVVAALAWRPVAARADEVAELIAEGDARAAAGDRRGALDAYEDALRRDADRRVVYDRATPLWIAEGAWADGVAWLEKATLRQPRYAAGWYALGYLYRRTGQIAAAVGAYQEFLALRPGDPSGTFGLAIALELADRPTDAARAYRRYLAVERDPARDPYRAQARAAIDRLVPAPANWRDALHAVVTGGATFAAWPVLAAPR
ncbi:MAG: tetratricopeptide repeat protein [Kofleriaceae bacterium]|nr:tetratricopeptide repeat protein [Kofleriaceae bacterium]MCB9573740.1 tetratricopeptide repeat protein [Kofleriaceae bacterium]